MGNLKDQRPKLRTRLLIFTWNAGPLKISALGRCRRIRMLCQLRDTAVYCTVAVP